MAKDGKQEAREENSPATNSRRPGMLRGVRLRLKVLFTNADGLVANGKELEFKNQIKGNKPDTVLYTPLPVNRFNK